MGLNIHNLGLAAQAN